jgi:DNA invertase Pin-like site-specific DNA recombinase
MLIGYAHLSIQDQTLDLQTDALTRPGCEKIFTDTTSGAKSDRPGLQEAMTHLRAGDTLVGRTLKHLIALTTDLSERDIGFVSLREPPFRALICSPAWPAPRTVSVSGPRRRSLFAVRTAGK